MNLLATVWHPDWTKAWGYAQTAVGLASTTLAGLATVITDPTFQKAVTTVVPGPYTGLGLAVLGVMTLVASAHPQK